MILENGGIFGLDYGLISRLGEPNNAGDREDCVTVLSVDENNMTEQFYYGGWNDDRCSKPYSFVCELFPISYEITELMRIGRGQERIWCFFFL